MKDLITQESEQLEGVLKYLEYAPDLCPKCGSDDIFVYKTKTGRGCQALPRIRECRECSARFQTREYVVEVLD